MLVRYGKRKNGKPEKVAEIFTVEEHGITRELIDPEAVSIIRRLASHGYKAFLVGGAVRDLLLGNTPKDFDVATDAVPARIRHIFRNSRIIGRRFPLVHVFFHDKIIEVSTFRTEGNDIERHGSAERDAWTRDFTINALFYDPEKEQIIDYVGAMKDMKDKIINPLLHPDSIFTEDPVRMLRAVKYSVITGFNLSKNLKSLLVKQCGLLAGCPSSRLTEELFKILSSGSAKSIFEQLINYKLLEHMMPVYDSHLKFSASERGNGKKAAVFASIASLDAAMSGNKPVARSEMIRRLVQVIIDRLVDWKEEREILYRDCFYKVKELLAPLTPPNAEVEGAVRGMFLERHLQPLHRRFLLRRR